MANRICFLLIAFLALAHGRATNNIEEEYTVDEYDQDHLKRTHVGTTESADVLLRSDLCLSDGLEGTPECLSDSWVSRNANLGSVKKLAKSLHKTLDLEEEDSDEQEFDDTNFLDEGDDEEEEDVDRHHHHHRGVIIKVKYSGNYKVKGNSGSVSAKETISVGKLSFPISVQETWSVGANSFTFTETAVLSHELVNATAHASLTATWKAKSQGKVTVVDTRITLNGHESISSAGQGGKVVKTQVDLTRLINGTAIIVAVGNEDAASKAVRVASSGDIAQGSTVVSSVGGKVVHNSSVAALVNWEGTTVAGRYRNFSRIDSHAFFGGLAVTGNKRSFTLQGTYAKDAEGGKGRARERVFGLSVAEGNGVRVAAEYGARVGSRFSGSTVKTEYLVREGESVRVRGHRRGFEVRVDVAGGQSVQVQKNQGSFKGGARVRVQARR